MKPGEWVIYKPSMSAKEPLDNERVHKLSFALLESIRDNYLKGPESRDRSLEALNALAAVSALVIMGADGLGGEAQDFFLSALSGNMVAESQGRSL
jgi:hypothetical protein